MTIAITIVGTLGLLLTSSGIYLIFRAEKMDDPSGDGQLAVGLIGFASFGIGWLFSIALYVLALCNNSSLDVILVGAFGVATPILSAIYHWLTRKIFVATFLGWGCIVALFVLALVK